MARRDGADDLRRADHGLVVLTIYFMADLPRLRHGMLRLFPRAHRAQSGRIADVMVDKVGAYMIGNLLISLAAGIASFAVFTALGGTVLGLVGALMAIPVAAGLKVVLAEQLHARDAADPQAGTSADHEPASPSALTQLVRWSCTVLAEMDSWPAISALDSPRAVSAQTPVSLRERPCP